MKAYTRIFADKLRLPEMGLVHRLRIAFVMIVVVIGVAIAMALWQFKILGTAQSNLLGSSVPVLVRTQVVERALNDLVILLGQIKAAPDQETLVPIRDSVNSQFAQARLSVAGLGRVPEHAEQTDLILRQMSVMETGIHTSLVVKRGLFRSEERLDDLLQRLNQERDGLRIAVELLTLRAGGEINRSVSDLYDRDTSDPTLFLEGLEDQVGRSRTISQLALELETISNVVGQLGKETSPERLRQTEDFLSFRMRGVLQLMVRLPDTEARADLAIRVGELRKTIFGPHGILNAIEEIGGRTSDLENQDATEKTLVREIVASTEKLMASAHSQLTQASQLTRVTTQRLILILAIAAIVVAIIVILAILFIVERQINSRVALLTGSVLRIAAGDTDHEIRVSGADELGRMAQSLEIFKKNALELLRSNAELEKFAYAAAHDLRSPLQAIHDLTVWTIEDEENDLSADSRENLAMLQSRVTRLSALLDDLLQYARVGADIAEPAGFDLDELIRETAAMVDPSGSFDVTLDWTGPKIETYLHPLQKILLNLMSNTLKHHGSPSGKIKVSSMLRGDRLWLTYSDDGPGIPRKYHSKVFELFQTLKPRDEMEGSGLGLAITQKLVEHFGGSVKLESDPETRSGTTFIFDFPAKPAVPVAKAA